MECTNLEAFMFLEAINFEDNGNSQANKYLKNPKACKFRKINNFNFHTLQSLKIYQNPKSQIYKNILKNVL